MWGFWDREEILGSQVKKVLQVKSQPLQEILDRKERKVYLETRDLKV